MPTPWMRATAQFAAILLVADTSSLLAAPTRSRAASHTSAPQVLLGRASVISAVEQQKVEEWLAALGCPPDRVKEVVPRLSPTDVHQLAMNIRQLQVAGVSRRQVVLTALVVVVVILVVLVVRLKPHVNLGDSY